MGKVRMIPGHQRGRPPEPLDGGSNSPPGRGIVVVHTSDLHVDDDYTAQIHGGDGTAGLAFVLQKAGALAADVALLVGDTFENNRLPRHVVDRAAALISAAAMPVVLLPGNHDPAAPDSVYGLLPAVDNLHVLGVTH